MFAFLPKPIKELDQRGSMEKTPLNTKINQMRSSMSLNVIGAIIFLLAVFGTLVSILGYVSFTKAFKKEYSTSTYHMADTAAANVNGDFLSEYLQGRHMNEYQRTKLFLDDYCIKMNVSLVYVIMVDTSDYGRFVSVFNSVNNAVDNSEYKVWELGYERNTTNNEYRTKYKALYDKEVLYETVYRTNPSDGAHPHITTMVPIKNVRDDVVAILCIQRPIRELREARQPYVITIGISTFVLALIAAALTVAFIDKQVVEPINKVTAEATRFASENTKGESLGSISRYEEFSSLAQSIDTMEKDMVLYMENLTAATAEKERIGTELSLARTIQSDSIPDVFPAFPDRKDFDIHAMMIPAKEVGGDFYNFFLVDDDHLAVVIGDVSGKGVPGSLTMMVTNILIIEKTRAGGSPAEILSFVNQRLCEHNNAEMFVTLWLGIIELSTGKVIAATAGHDDAIIYRKNGRFYPCKTKHGLATGAFLDSRYKNFEIRLGKGDKLFLFTDGVTEATDQNEEMFRADRLLNTLNEYKEGTPQQILEAVHESVKRFVGDAPQFDDLTMLCFELKEDTEQC